MTAPLPVNLLCLSVGSLVGLLYRVLPCHLHCLVVRPLLLGSLFLNVLKLVHGGEGLDGT